MVKFQHIISLFISSAIVGCGLDEPTTEIQRREFQFPVCNFPAGSGEEIDTSGQLSARIYLMESPTENKLDFDFRDLKNYDENFNLIPDSVPFSLMSNLELHIDNSQEFTVKYQDRNIATPPVMDEDGILFDTYKSPYDSVKVFPAYLVNFSDSVQMVQFHDGDLVLIQEAMTPNLEWKPIEYFVYSDCGNSFSMKFLDTNAYFMFGIHKYKGDFYTNLRVRMLNNGRIILSNVYSGYINKSQFEQLEKNNMFHNYIED